MRRKHKLLDKLSKNWLSRLDPEEVKQEELIQAWKNPDIDGYQGLAAFKELLFRLCKESSISSKHVTLKKNTPDKNSGVRPTTNILYDYLLSIPQEDRGLFCVAIQPFLQEIYYGNSIPSIELQSKYMGISKSSLGRLLKSFRDSLN